MSIAVTATMLAGPMLLAAVPAGRAAVPQVSASPSPAALTEAEVFLFSAMQARDDARASRGQARAAALATPSTPAPAAVQPPITVEPPPAAEPPAVVGTLWATTDVNVRAGAAGDTERIGSVAALARVDVTGTTGQGWTQVVVDGRVGWVNSAYLSQTEPVPAVDPAPAPEAASVPSDVPCSIDPEIESDLTSNARAVYRAVCAAHGGSVSGFGGLRPGDDGDHGSGRAVDIMVSGAAGREISAFLQARAGELGITYVIYEQQMWTAGSPDGAWERMENRGGATANHYDHVHVSVS